MESCSRMPWRVVVATTPDRIAAADVVAHAYGIGPSGRRPSAVTIGARIACLSSCYRFLLRMGLVTSNPCDLVEGPRQSACPARGYSADDGSRSRAFPWTWFIDVTAELRALHAAGSWHGLEWPAAAQAPNITAT